VALKPLCIGQVTNQYVTDARMPAKFTLHC
jgi:hypothetical protein